MSQLIDIHEDDGPTDQHQQPVVDDIAAPGATSRAEAFRVSVVMPAYNAAATIGEALESLLAQTHCAWEAIVVDDGSTDDTASVVEEFVQRDQRIRLVRRSNGGESAARNTGLATAEGEWLLFLDADDWIAPEHLKRLTIELAANTGLDAVHCGYARVPSNGELLVEPYTPPAGDMFAILARRAAFAVHACIVRRSVVEKVGGFDESLRKSPDWDLWQRVARTGAKFGHVDEILAFYRMQPHSASLDARLMLIDGLRVLERGHAPDPRVANPDPRHAQGLASDGLDCQKFYLLCWCAGLMLGNGDDPSPLFEYVADARCAELYADAVARCLFDAAILPGCQSPADWEHLWVGVWAKTAAFLNGLENYTTAEGLADKSIFELKKLVLKHAPSWNSIIDDYEQSLADLRQRFTQLEHWHGELQHWRQNVERDRDNWRLIADERQRSVAEQGAYIREIEHELGEQESALVELRWRAANQEQEIRRQRDAISTLEAQTDRLQNERRSLTLQVEGIAAELHRVAEQRDLLTSECNALLQSVERRAGDFLLNRLRLRTPAHWAWSIVAGGGQQATNARLATERRLSKARSQLRVMAAACWNFPIYSQTFVYQELCQLARNGCAVRIAYSKLGSRDQLQSQFSSLWRQKRRLYLSRTTHERDYVSYRNRFPSKVALLEDKICRASKLSRETLVSHINYLEAYTFARMVEAYRPHYLHSYFFYDRSFMTLVAGYLLDIPRGVTCYADHMLQDYELKVVPLHLELCDIVVATSERIKAELLSLAPHANADRILVKPNGIDVERFPVVERSEPRDGEPFRLVTVCRIEPKKGLLELVEAVALLRRQGVRVEAHIVGEVDEWSDASRAYKQQLDIRITELGLWGAVHLEGRQGLEGIQRFLGASQLFVAPFVETDSGDKDGIPTSLLEGMSTGLPVVATDAGSIPEVIDDGREGVLVPQRDAVALAAAIKSVLPDVGRRRQLGQTAAAKIRDRYDARICEAAFHGRLESLVAMRRATPIQS